MLFLYNFNSINYQIMFVFIEICIVRNVSIVRKYSSLFKYFPNLFFSLITHYYLTVFPTLFFSLIYMKILNYLLGRSSYATPSQNLFVILDFPILMSTNKQSIYVLLSKIYFTNILYDQLLNTREKIDSKKIQSLGNLNLLQVFLCF